MRFSSVRIRSTPPFFLPVGLSRFCCNLGHIRSTLLMLGLTEAALKKIEHVMRDLAVESHKGGYISIQGFQRQLERPR